MPEICFCITKNFILIFFNYPEKQIMQKCLYSPEKDHFPEESSAKSSLGLKENFILL